MAHRVHTSSRSSLAFLCRLTVICLVLYPFQQSHALSPAQSGGWVEVLIPAIDGFKISFADSLHGWIVSSSGAILYSNDAGATWQARQCPTQIEDAELVSDRTGWVRRYTAIPGSDSVLYKTTDAGISWSLMILPRRLSSYQSVSFINDSTVYAALDSSSRSSLWATSDGGETWNRRGNLTGLAGINMDFFNTAIGYAGNWLVGEPTPMILIRTTDGGFNWTTIEYTNYEPGNFESFRFTGGKLGSYRRNYYPEVGPRQFALNLTWNGGQSWVSYGSLVTPEYRTGMARDSAHRWLVRATGAIRRTTNAGATWQDDTLAVPISEILYDLHGHQFALGGGRLFRYDSALTDAAGPPFVPQEFALLQNYPNPFNPTTTITYNLSSLEFVSLKVFDVLGREVATLVSEVKKAGRYEVTFSASNLATGVYFYRLQVGRFNEVKKFIVLR